jgi:hypothetical protein
MLPTTLQSINLKLDVNGRPETSSRLSWKQKCEMWKLIENLNSNGAVLVVPEVTVIVTEVA